MGVLTSETLTPIFAGPGACWTAAPGCGVIGPEGDCAARESANAATPNTARKRIPVGEKNLEETWQFMRSPPNPVYRIRRNYGDKRCRGPLQFLEWKWTLWRAPDGCTTTETETDARTPGAAQRPGLPGKHGGAADSHPGGIPAAAGASEEGRDCGHDCD